MAVLEPTQGSMVRGAVDFVRKGGAVLVTANLIASVLVEMAADLFACLAPGGFLICGGIICERKAEVVEALSAAGLTLKSFKEREDWVSLLFGRDLPQQIGVGRE